MVISILFVVVLLICLFGMLLMHISTETKPIKEFVTSKWQPKENDLDSMIELLEEKLATRRGRISTPVLNWIDPRD